MAGRALVTGTTGFLARAVAHRRQTARDRTVDDALVGSTSRHRDADAVGGIGAPPAHTMACSAAQRAISARRRRPVFSRVRVRWFCTVRGLMYSCLAISSSVRPSATRRTTSSSRGASSGRAARPPSPPLE